MRRLLLLLTAGGLAVAAALAPRPAPVEPQVPATTEVPGGVAGASGSVWYCPWAVAGADEDTVLAVASLADALVDITLPSPFPGEDPDTEGIGIGASSARGIEVGAIARRGDAPGFVEFSDGPATVGVAAAADDWLAGDRCLRSLPKAWHVSGGTTREGAGLVLRLFNPFPDNAKVAVTGSSDFGVQPFPELAAFDVPGRQWRDIELDRLVPFLDDLSVTVRSDDGIFPVFIQDYGGDRAVWPGTGLSTMWEFPVTAVIGHVPELVVVNPGRDPLPVEIDVFSSAGPGDEPVPLIVEPDIPARLDLSGLADGLFGVRVRADGPVAAVVLGRGTVAGELTDDGEPVFDGRLAATVGAAGTSTRWILAGPGAVPDVRSQIWILNSGAEPLRVSVIPLGNGAGIADKVVVGPGSVGAVTAAEVGVAAYLIEGDVPFTAAWAAIRDDATAFFAGVALDE